MIHNNGKEYAIGAPKDDEVVHISPKGFGLMGYTYLCNGKLLLEEEVSEPGDGREVCSHCIARAKKIKFPLVE